jgi:hypothetical protein
MPATRGDPNDPLAGIVPRPPLPPVPAPPVVVVAYGYEQLNAFRLQSQPYIMRATHDEVQRMLEDGLLERYEGEHLDWLEWVQANS